ncbi:MAG: ankyrin repeat domain-containing protein, partial [Acidobacteriota bacterium]
EQVDIIRELRKRGADPASASLPQLVRGADRPDIVELALSAGVDLNATDPKTGKTALHEAATYGYLRTVERLIEAGADTSARDS